jgi:hypothetical protein
MEGVYVESTIYNIFVDLEKSIDINGCKCGKVVTL